IEFKESKAKPNKIQTLGNRLVICINEASKHTNSHPIIHIRNGSGSRDAFGMSQGASAHSEPHLKERGDINLKLTTGYNYPDNLQKANNLRAVKYPYYIAPKALYMKDLGGNYLFHLRAFKGLHIQPQSAVIGRTSNYQSFTSQILNEEQKISYEDLQPRLFRAADMHEKPGKRQPMISTRGVKESVIYMASAMVGMGRMEMMVVMLLRGQTMPTQEAAPGTQSQDSNALDLPSAYDVKYASITTKRVQMVSGIYREETFHKSVKGYMQSWSQLDMATPFSGNMAGPTQIIISGKLYLLKDVQQKQNLHSIP
ncbi:hypothetical protein EI555_016147, partial [Monodon monoceros]